jgi:hypothetical protein
LIDSGKCRAGFVGVAFDPAVKDSLGESGDSLLGHEYPAGLESEVAWRHNAEELAVSLVRFRSGELEFSIQFLVTDQSGITNQI